MTNNEVKLVVAMPAALGLFLVSYIGMMVGLVMLGFGDAPSNKAMVFAFLPWAGVAFGLAAVISYLDNNLFDSVLFAILAVVIYSIPGVMGSASGFTDKGMFVFFAAAFLFAMTYVSLNIPIRMVTITLLIASFTFLFLGMWVWNGMESGIIETLTGVFAILLGLISFYLPTALMFNIMKGEKTLPVF